MKKRKPKDLLIESYGCYVEVKADPKMSNMWMGGGAISLKDAKRLKKWLGKFIEYQEAK